jgi:hypothetical protein
MLREMFDSICLIARALIQCSFGSVSSIGKHVYTSGFEYFEKKHKHELVKILVDLVICSSDFCKDNALDILIDLSQTKHLVQFSMEIKTLLDFIEYCNLNQIRKLYLIVCSIAYNKNGESSNSIQDNFHMLITKQLGSNILKVFFVKILVYLIINFLVINKIWYF